MTDTTIPLLCQASLLKQGVLFPDILGAAFVPLDRRLPILALLPAVEEPCALRPSSEDRLLASQLPLWGAASQRDLDPFGCGAQPDGDWGALAEGQCNVSLR